MQQKNTSPASTEKLPTYNMRERDFAVVVCVRRVDSVATMLFVHRLWGGVYLLLLQLPDGVLCFLKALTGCVALLPHHRQLPLDHVVLLCFLRPRHLTLKQHARGGWSKSSVQFKHNADNIYKILMNAKLLCLRGTLRGAVLIRIRFGKQPCLVFCKELAYRYHQQISSLQYETITISWLAKLA